MPNPSVFNTAVVQSFLLGDSTGNRFNDLETVLGFPSNVTINTINPITKLTIMHGDVVDGITCTYSLDGGEPVTKSHGTSTASADPDLSISPVPLSATENIIAITGRQGQTPNFNIRVTQITFVIYDSSNGTTRTAGPFGKGNNGTPFRSTANGNFVAFGGFSVDTDYSAGQAKKAGHYGGLYGLIFADIAYVTA